MKQSWELLYEQLIKTENTTKYSSWNVNFFTTRICPCSGLLFTLSYHFNCFLLMILQHCEQHKVASTIRREPDRNTIHALSARHLDQVPSTVIYYCKALITSGIGSRFPEIMDNYFLTGTRGKIRIWQTERNYIINNKMPFLNLLSTFKLYTFNIHSCTTQSRYSLCY